MCPFSYAVVSSSTSITRMSGSSSCPSSQSVETSTSGFAYSVMRMSLLAFDVGAVGGSILGRGLILQDRQHKRDGIMRPTSPRARVWITIPPPPLRQALVVLVL